MKTVRCQSDQLQQVVCWSDSPRKPLAGLTIVDKICQTLLRFNEGGPFMNDLVKSKLLNVVIPVLSSMITVLLIIPGNQGENILTQVLVMLKAWVGA